jgi:hypothetical protein
MPTSRVASRVNDRLARWVVAPALGVAAWLAAPGALAATDGPRVVLFVAPGPGEGLTGRIRAELEALNVTVVEVLEPDDAEPPRLDWATDSHARAAVRVAPSREVIEIWFPPRSGEEARTDSVPLDGASETVAAVRVGERIRAELLEPPPTTEPPAPTGPPPARPEVLPVERPLPVPPSSAAHPLELGVGAMALASPGGVGPVGLGMAVARVRLAEGFGVFAVGALPATTADLSGAQGKASVSLALAGAGLDLTFRLPHSPLALRAAGGQWLVFLPVRGEAVAPFRDQSQTLTSTASFVSLGLDCRLLPGVTLAAEALVAEAWSSAIIRFAGEQVAHWGQPLAGAELTARVGLF